MFNTQKIDDQVKTETYSNSTLKKKNTQKKKNTALVLDWISIGRSSEFSVSDRFWKKWYRFIPNLNAFNCPADGAAIKFVHRYQDNSTFINDVLENNLFVVYLGNSLRPFTWFQSSCSNQPTNPPHPQKKRIYANHTGHPSRVRKYGNRGKYGKITSLIPQVTIGITTL